MGKRIVTEERKSAIVRVGFVEVFGEGSEKKNYKGKFCLAMNIPKTIKQLDGIKISDEGKKKIVKEGKEMARYIRDEAKKMCIKQFGEAELDGDPDDKNDNGVSYEPVMDGDKKKSKKKKEPISPGYYMINMWSKRKPVIMKPKNADGEITDANQGEFYAGCWAKIYFNLFTYDTDGNLGVSVGLGNIKKVYDDTALGAVGKKWGDDDEDEIEEVEAEEGDFDDETDEEDEFDKDF